MKKEQWQAIRDNGKNHDGQFLYGLKTTKTVCRSSCIARSCNPKNLVVFDTLEEAVAQGFRPCRRCRPDQMGWKGIKVELADSAKQFIELHYAEKFSLVTIAEELYVNSSYLLRVFKEITGNTLLYHHNYTRCQAARTLLARPELSIAFISREVGFISASHFTRVFKSLCNCTPSEYRTRCLENQV